MSSFANVELELRLDEKEPYFLIHQMDENGGWIEEIDHLTRSASNLDELLDAFLALPIPPAAFVNGYIEGFLDGPFRFDTLEEVWAITYRYHS